MNTLKMKLLGRAVACAVWLLVLAAITGCAVSAATESAAPAESQTTAENTENTENTETASTEKSATTVSVSNEAVDKDETVYVITDAAGVSQQVIVSDHLRNPKGEATLRDASNLTGIENVKGNEGYSGSASNMTWKANGKDIYYRGTTTEQLPFEVSIRYELDGKEISPADLAGKSGRVAMTFNYKVNRTMTVQDGDEQVAVPLPFMAITGMVLDNDQFTNIEVDNGKVLDDGDRTMVVGLALPGLEEALGLDKEEPAETAEADADAEEDGKGFDLDIDIPGSVTVTADVTDFSLDTTMTMASCDMLSDLDVDDVNSLDDLSDALEELTDASSQLVDGSNELYDGIRQLYDKSGDLIDGVNDLSDGAKKLNDGAKQLKDGTTDLYFGADQINGGASSLAGGLGQLSSNSSDLVSGARQIVDAVFASATQQIKDQGVALPEDLTLENYTEVLQQVSDAVASTITEEAVRAGLEQKGLSGSDTQNLALYIAADIKTENETMEAAVVRAGAKLQNAQTVQTISASAGSLTEEEQAALAQLVPTIMAGGADQDTAQLIALVALKTSPTDPASGIDNAVSLVQDGAYVQGMQQAITQDPNAAETIAAGIAQIIKEKQTAVGGQFADVLDQLNSVKKFYNGLQTYTAGVDSARAGANQLSSGALELKRGAEKLQDGAAELYKGTTDLYDGTQKLAEGGVTLRDGVKKLKNGAGELRDGMEKFDEEGIQKITNVFEGDLNNVVDRLHDVADGANAYNNFSGIASGATGKVKFIFKTAGIGD